MSVALTTVERLDLEKFEGIVQRGIDTFVKVGRALAEIRDRRLYRDSHGTFEEYCDERWLLGRTRAYQLIDAAVVVMEMSTMVDTPPANERQARELVPLKDDEQAMVEVWRDLRERYGDRLTARLVKAEVEEFLARRPTVVCPECGRRVLVERLDASRRWRPSVCTRCGNKIPVETAISAYVIDTERKRCLAEKAVERFWAVITARTPALFDAEPIHKVIRLERALAILTDEEIEHAIEQLEKGIAETKALLVELRRGSP